MLGTKAMSQIETTSYKWLIQPLLSYHTRQQTNSPRNQIKLLHVVCETIRRKKLLKLSKLYKVNPVEG